MSSLINKPIVRLHLFGYVFTPHLIPTLGVLLLLPLLISLGMWQLNRADYKSQLLSQYQNRQLSEPLALQKLGEPVQQIEFYPIRVTGRFDNRHQFLIDNRIQNHRVGFYVITPFIVGSKPKKIILVNRGWIPRLPTRNQLPIIKPVRGKKTIVGILRLPPSKHFVLGVEPETKKWPKLLQALDYKKIARYIKKPMYPYIVLLSPKSPHGYIRNWQPVPKNSANKHYGYAIQWFALALTLVIIYIVVNSSRAKRKQ